jgi:hypothetical protein
MKYKYGTYPNEQFDEYKKRIHSLIHWLLIYKEENAEILPGYFEKVQSKLDGLNELMNHPVQIVEIMNLIESARLESEKEDMSFRQYRKLILDAHDLVDSIEEGKDEPI